MDAKHQFKYTYNETCIDEYSPHEITFEMPGSATLDQILYNFESYLKACGFHFDGHLDIVDLDGSLYEFNEEEPKGGCMADFDKDVLDESEDCCGDECGCESTSSPLENDEYYKSKKLKEWSEGLAKLEAELKAEREIREKASLRADELKQMEERWKKVSNEKKASILADVLKASGL